MNVKITKLIKPNGDHFFCVYADEKYVKGFYFEPDREATSVCNEDYAFGLAKELANKLESNIDLNDKEETVYESGKNDVVASNSNSI